MRRTLVPISDSSTHDQDEVKEVRSKADEVIDGKHRLVRFEKEVQVRQHLHSDDMSLEEMRHTWYSSREIESMKEDKDGMLSSQNSSSLFEDAPALGFGSLSHSLSDENLFVLSPTPEDTVKVHKKFKELALEWQSNSTMSTLPLYEDEDDDSPPPKSHTLFTSEDRIRTMNGSMMEHFHPSLEDTERSAFSSEMPFDS